jgi:hypothetical protein
MEWEITPLRFQLVQTNRNNTDKEKQLDLNEAFLQSVQHDGMMEKKNCCWIFLGFYQIEKI